MYTAVLEFETEAALQEAVQHLWTKVGISGEMLYQRLSDGRWRLEVVAEQALRTPTLEKLGGRLVSASAGRAAEGSPRAGTSRARGSTDGEDQG